MELTSKAEEFINRKFSFKNTSDRILASREAKDLILEINSIYKESKEPKLMELMKAITGVKQKIEKRLKGKPL